jgi:hypothetical protein
MTVVNYTQLVAISNLTGEEIKAHPDQWKGHMRDLGLDPDAALDWSMPTVHAHSNGSMPPEGWLLIGVHYGLVIARERAVMQRDELNEAVDREAA